jgi:hypothetical protein
MLYLHKTRSQAANIDQVREQRHPPPEIVRNGAAAQYKPGVSGDLDG